MRKEKSLNKTFLVLCCLIYGAGFLLWVGFFQTTVHALDPLTAKFTDNNSDGHFHLNSPSGTWYLDLPVASNSSLISYPKVEITSGYSYDPTRWKVYYFAGSNPIGNTNPSTISSVCLDGPTIRGLLEPLYAGDWYRGGDMVFTNEYAGGNTYVSDQCYIKAGSIGNLADIGVPGGEKTYSYEVELFDTFTGTTQDTFTYSYIINGRVGFVTPSARVYFPWPKIYNYSTSISGTTLTLTLSVDNNGAYDSLFDVVHHGSGDSDREDLWFKTWIDGGAVALGSLTTSDSISGYTRDYNISSLSNGEHTLHFKVRNGYDSDGDTLDSDTNDWDQYNTDQIDITFTKSPPAPAPTVDIRCEYSASATFNNASQGPCTVPVDGDIQLLWQSTNATSCSISPSGFSGTSGSQRVYDVQNSTDYTITCTGAGGIDTDTVQVTVSGATSVNGACGTRARSYTSAEPCWGTYATYCSIGNPVGAPASCPAAGSSSSWTCQGADGGSPATCTVSVAGSSCSGTAGINQYNACLYSFPIGSSAGFNPSMFITELQSAAPLYHNWGTGTAFNLPGPAYPSDYFAIRFLGRFNFAGGNYNFYSSSDDGIRAYIDNTLASNLIIDRWYDHGPPATPWVNTRFVSPGSHDIIVEYYEKSTASLVSFRWEKDGNDSTCASITAPGSVTTGQTFPATVVMKNTGTKTWEFNSTIPDHNLGAADAQVAPYTSIWGGTRAYLPLGTIVASGSNATFEFTATAPSTAGTYAFDWKMVEDGTEWFGATCSKNIVVTAAPLPATASISAGSTNIPYNTSTNLNWSYSNATSCTATAPAAVGGYPNGSGSASTGNLTSSRTYTFACNPVGVNSSDSVTVNVQAQPNGLTVIKTGQGTVTSSPPGINCGSDCQENYLPDTLVRLTETPASGRIFTGWSGVTCNEGSQRESSCSFIMSSNATVIANFAVNPNFEEF